MAGAHEGTQIVKIRVGTLLHLTGGDSAVFGAVGLDKARFAFPLASEPDWDSVDWTHRINKGNQRSATSTGLIAGMSIRARRLESGIWGTIDMTPAYMLGAATNVKTPGDRFLIPLASSAFEIATDILGLEPACDFGSIHLTRLDLTRDVTLPPWMKASDLLHSLSAFQATYGKFSNLARNGRVENETLFYGNNSRSVRIYDKFGQSSSPDASGVLRWECQLRKGFLARNGLSELSDITRPKVGQLRRDVWAWSGMDSVHFLDGSPKDVFTPLISERNIGANALAAVIGRAILDLPSTPSRTRQKDQATIRRLGLSSHLQSLRSALANQGPGRSFTIDFATGELREGEDQLRD